MALELTPELQVYFVGDKAHKLMKTNRSNANNYGYDDERGDPTTPLLLCSSHS